MLRIPQIPKWSGLVPQYGRSRCGDLTAEESAIKLSKRVHIMLVKSRPGKKGSEIAFERYAEMRAVSA